MRKLYFFMLITISLWAMNSCSVATSTTTKRSDILGAGVIHIPVVANLLVSEDKVSDTVVVRKASLIQRAREEALAKAIKRRQADILIEPIYEIKKKGRKITVIVTGFPGMYKNFRSITPEDSALFKIGNTFRRADSYDAQATFKEKRVKLRRIR